MDSTPPDPSKQVELDELRRAMDEADDAILDALARRAAIAKRLGTLRRDESQVYLPRRERDQLARIEAHGAGLFPKRALGPVFREIWSASLALEAPLRVAYEGPLGSVSHEAARKRFGASAAYLPCEGTRASVQLVEREHADVAVVLIESPAEGLMQPALEALGDSELKVVDEVPLEVRIHLLNHSGNMQAIDKVFAAPAERTACARFLSTNLPKAQVLDARTSATAAESAAADPGAAALGGSAVGEAFGLSIARGNVADEAGEQLRCVVLGARPSPRTGSDVTAVMLAVDDAPGALIRVLRPLADKDLNVRRIQSRPRPRHGDQSVNRLYFEVSGHVTDRALVTALDEMRRSVRGLKILGSYPSDSRFSSSKEGLTAKT